MVSWTLESPAVDLACRASLGYWAVHTLLRFTPKRQAGTLSPHDMMLSVIVGCLIFQGVRPERIATADAALMIAVIVGWNAGIPWVVERFPAIRWIMRERSTCLVRDGRPDVAAMKREMISDEELKAELRKAGAEDISKVRRAYLEADGQISVVPY